MYAHKKARRDTENAPGLETQKVVPQCGTITTTKFSHFKPFNYIHRFSNDVFICLAIHNMYVVN